MSVRQRVYTDSRWSRMRAVLQLEACALDLRTAFARRRSSVLARLFRLTTASSRHQRAVEVEAVGG